MKAYVTSIGETTTDLCVWSLKRNGFDVVLLKDSTSLASKLKQIYNMADDDFVRVDADVVPNQNLTEANLIAALGDRQWWVQFQSFDWFKQDTAQGGIQFIKKECIPALRRNIDSAINAERPESKMYRLPEFHNPRRCDWHSAIMGLQNYRNDATRVRATKDRRQQSGYDWELAERLNEL